MEGGGGGGGVIGVLIGGSELEWEMRRTGWGGSTGCIMHRVHTNTFNGNTMNNVYMWHEIGVKHSRASNHQCHDIFVLFLFIY